MSAFVHIQGELTKANTNTNKRTFASLDRFEQVLEL